MNLASDREERAHQWILQRFARISAIEPDWLLRMACGQTDQTSELATTPASRLGIMQAASPACGTHIAHSRRNSVEEISRRFG